MGDWAHDPGDEEILSRAHAEGRVVVTLDKDFGELAIVHAQAHSGIVRLSNISLRLQAGVILRILDGHGDRLRRGAVVTAEPGRLRVRVQEEP